MFDTICDMKYIITYLLKFIKYLNTLIYTFN